MADHTALQACILTCPPDETGAVVGLLAQHALGHDDAPLVLGAVYVCPDARLGSATELADALKAAVPEVVFLVWEDPKLEWLGTVCVHVPGLGDYAGSCDAQGTPLWTLKEILAMTSSGTDELLALKELFDRIDEMLEGPDLTESAAPVRPGGNIEYRVTFAVKYAEEPHPTWPPAHPDGWLAVFAPDEDTARAATFGLLGTAWCQLTGPERIDAAPGNDMYPDVDWFPRGELGELHC